MKLNYLFLSAPPQGGTVLSTADPDPATAAAPIVFSTVTSTTPPPPRATEEAPWMRAEQRSGDQRGAMVAEE
jgi:hypothetical protein